MAGWLGAERGRGYVSLAPGDDDSSGGDGGEGRGKVSSCCSLYAKGTSVVNASEAPNPSSFSASRTNYTVTGADICISEMSYLLTVLL